VRLRGKSEENLPIYRRSLVLAVGTEHVHRSDLHFNIAHQAHCAIKVITTINKQAEERASTTKPSNSYQPRALGQQDPPLRIPSSSQPTVSFSRPNNFRQHRKFLAANPSEINISECPMASKRRCKHQTLLQERQVVRYMSGHLWE